MEFVLTSYPNAAGLGTGSPLDLEAGQAIEKLTLRMQMREAVRIQGSVKLPPELFGNQGIRVSLQHRESIFGMDAISGLGTFASRDGSFRIDSVPAGSYLISVASVRSTTPEVLHRQPMEVHGRDLENVELVAQEAFKVTGWIRSDRPDSDRDFRGASGLRVHLLPPDVPSVNPPTATVRVDGGFEFDRVRPGTYIISLDPVPQDLYVKSIIDGEVVLPERKISFAGASQGDRLKVILGTDGGRIEGRMLDQVKGSAPPDSSLRRSPLLALVPEPDEPFEDSYKVTALDQQGTFRFIGVRPGRYYLYLWTNPERGAWYDPDARQRADWRSERLDVPRNGVLMVEVPRR